MFGPIYDMLDLCCSGCHQVGLGDRSISVLRGGWSAIAPSDPSDQHDGAHQEAYTAAIPKINLDDPAQSRFVIRLRDESAQLLERLQRHRTAGNANVCRPRSRRWPMQIQVDADPRDLTVSKALTLYDGTVASGGNRYEAT